MTGVQYRIVQTVITKTGVFESEGTADETYHEDISAIVRTGTLDKTPEQIERQTAESLEFYEDEVVIHEGGNEEYLYYLQILDGDKWRNVKSLQPRPYVEDDENEDCEDPLAGDTDDGSDYIPDAGPLTPHYFALKARGEI